MLPLALILAAVLAQEAPQAPKPSGPTTPSQPSQPSHDLLSVQPPKVRALLSKRAKWCIRLPDGRLCNLTRYYETLEAIKRAFRKRDMVQTDSKGGVRTSRKSGEEWVIADVDLFMAWKLGWYVSDHANLVAQTSYRDDRGILIGAWSPLDLPLWEAVDAESLPFFLFVDEKTRDAILADQSGHYSEVLEWLAGDIARVAIAPLGDDRREYHVKLPDGWKKKDTWLPGRYLLWPDLTIKHPAPTGEPAEPNDAKTWKPSNTVYRFVPLTEASSVTPADLAEAVLSGRLKLQTRTWKKSGDQYVWTTEDVELVRPPISAPTPK